MSVPQTTPNPAYSVASLYVGDLNQDVTEAMLFEKFSATGPVLSIRVCRDVSSRRSLGYAYVNYQNPTDAQNALANMNFDEMKGRPMRIMWSQRDPSLRRSGKNNIFIKNLDKTIDNRSLYEVFQAFGPIMSCKVAQDEVGASRGYGFVHFETEDSAKKAIERVDGMLLNDRKVFVGPFVPRKERMKNRDNTMFTNVYVKNFPDSFTDDELRDMFATYGSITSCKVMRKEDGSSRGFGFCAFQDAAAADAAVKDLHEKEHSGKEMYVSRAQKRSERDHELQKIFHLKKAERQKNYQGVNLYIKNLEDEITDDLLRVEFSAYGSITSAKVMVDDKGVSKGFGFVCFSSPEEATKAVTEMNNRIIGRKPLYVALAQRKEERKAQLAAQLLNHTIPQGGAVRLPGQQMGQMFPPAMYMQMPGRGGAFMPPHTQLRAPARAAGSFRPFMMGQNPGAFMPPVGMPQQRMNSSRLPRHIGGRSSNAPQQRSNQSKSRSTATPYQAQQTRHSAPATTTTTTAAGQAAAPPAAATAAENIDTEKLARSTPQEQKQMLGERLFPKVREIDHNNSGKITGMLLEIDNSEILHMLESDESLRAKVEEARDVLRAHHTNGTSDPKIGGK